MFPIDYVDQRAALDTDATTFLQTLNDRGTDGYARLYSDPDSDVFMRPSGASPTVYSYHFEVPAWNQTAAEWLTAANALGADSFAFKGRIYIGMDGGRDVFVKSDAQDATFTWEALEITLGDGDNVYDDLIDELNEKGGRGFALRGAWNSRVDGVTTWTLAFMKDSSRPGPYTYRLATITDGSTATELVDTAALQAADGYALIGALFGHSVSQAVFEHDDTRTAAIGALSACTTPRRIWSSSMDSNKALKLPSPKPLSPLRWMISKKIGPITVSVKICSSLPPCSVGAPSIRVRFCFSRLTSSTWPGRRLSTSSS